jgi:superfamily II DNA or RNA helicase
MKTMRPYQIDAHAKVLEAFERYASTLVVLPTGMGKTVVAAKLMTGWERGNCLFLAHTTELIEQAAESLASEMDGYRPVVEMNVRGADPNLIEQGGLIVVGSVQSMFRDRRLLKYAPHPFGLIVVDECHRATGASYRKVINFFRDRNPGLKVLGLTATPKRADNTSLGLVFESEAYQTSINPAIADGWLVPIRQRAVVIEGLDFTGLRTRLNEVGEKDFSDEQLEQIINEEKTLQGFARATFDLAGDRKTIAFTPGVRSAHQLASILNRLRDGCAEAIDGETPKDIRPEMVRRFRDGQTQFLCNCSVLTEGFDAPTCSCIAMCRPTKSVGRYVQMLGRGLRPLPGTVDGHPAAFDRQTAIFTSDKPDCLVLDFAGVSEHKLVDVWDALGGAYDAETVELAEASGEKQNVSDDLEKAKLLRMLMLQWEERKPIVADKVEYTQFGVSPFGDGARPVLAGGPKRGGATDPQVALLVKLGVAPETAAGYSKRQAGAVIDSIAATRCTDKQGQLLRKHGIDPAGIGMDQASRIIDAIARNGWRRPPELPE